MKKTIYTVLFLFLGNILLQAQETKIPDFVKNDLDSYIKKGMKDWQIPGLSLAIVKDGEVILQKGYGVLENGKKKKVDEHTTFMIGSNTKAFTATVLAMLAEERKLKLRDKVSMRLPGFQLKNPLATHEATIEDLLSHRIGFKTFQGDFTYWLSNLSRQDVIKRMRKINPPYGLREKWGYCNACYLAAGEIIPKLIQKSWSETVKEKILQPLKMDRTLMLCADLENATNNATAHSLVNGNIITLPSHHLPNRSIDNLAPAGSMSSSAADMAIWLLAQLNNGKVAGEEVLSADALQATRQPKSILGINPLNKQDTHFYLYGLGWMIKDRAGRVTYSHTGGVDGFLSSVVFIPEEQLGIVVLTNTDQNNFFQSLSDQIRDAFLGLPFVNYSDQALQATLKERAQEKDIIDQARAIVKQGNKPTVSLEAFEGKYTNEVYGEIEIKKKGDKLVIHFSQHPDLTATLSHMKDNNFLCEYSNPLYGIVEMPFKVRGREVAGLSLRVNDFIEQDEYSFMKVSGGTEMRGKLKVGERN